LWLKFFHFPCNFAVFPGKKISMRLSWRNARRLLEYTDISLKEAAQDAGFSDYGYFGRSFKRLFGITPDLLRKMDRDGALPGPEFPFPYLKWQNYRG
jgi:AraC-like DNA-binding protein